MLVVDVSKTPRKILARTQQILRRTPTILLGIVANKSRWPDYGDIRDYLVSLHQEKPKAGALSLPSNLSSGIPAVYETSNEQATKASSTTPTTAKELNFTSIHNEPRPITENTKPSSMKTANQDDLSKETTITVPVPRVIKESSDDNHEALLSKENK
jgi:hypothetical protein